MSKATAAIKKTIIDRVAGFEEQVERDLAAVENGGPGMHYALALFQEYARLLKDEIELCWRSSPDDPDELRRLMDHFTTRALLYDKRFGRGHQRVPRSLIATVDEECKRFGLMNCRAVLTVGEPGNFTTFVADLANLLFGDLQSQPTFPPDGQFCTPVMIAVPGLEGTRTSWRPIIVGHELAHYLQSAKPITPGIDRVKRLSAERMEEISSSLPTDRGIVPVRRLQQTFMRWLNELLCDAFAIHRYGAAGFASIVEFLESARAIDTISFSHPPGALRAWLMLKWLGDDMSSVEATIVEPYRAFADKPSHPEWVEYFVEVLDETAADIWTDVTEWAGTDAYIQRGRGDIIKWISDEILSGMPGGDMYPGEVGPIRVEEADVVNACWLANQQPSATPVDRLGAKALDDLEFIKHWTSAGGTQPEHQQNSAVEPRQGVLSRQDITARINSQGPLSIRISPRLPDGIHGASLDVHLGNRFIVFQQSATATFDAIDLLQDPRSMQFTVEKAWGDTFFLHPGQLVLAATLEYLILPRDLTAQLVTRPSYGRLGLISATAVQVHPHYAGCLTLELVNLGEMPLSIMPGERIAQLVFHTTSTDVQPSANPKYRYPTGPEFSKLRSDDGIRILRSMRRSFMERQALTWREAGPS
jgi:deoxycytidine triphosphate deaminase